MKNPSFNSSLGIVAGIALAASSIASADVYFGGGGDLVDAGVFTSDIVVSDHLSLTSVDLSLIGMDHSWAGDLKVTLTHLDSGFSTVIVDRIGYTGSGFGDSSNYGGTYTFGDTFGASIWTAAAGGGTSFVIPGGSYFASVGLTGAQTLIDPVFAGVDIFGTWRLTIEDFAAGDEGKLEEWSLSIKGTPVPGPGALALFGLAGLGARRRRR